MPSVTVENYLKQLYQQQQAHGDDLVPMGMLARAMEVTPGTATSMMKTLAESDLVEYQPRTGSRLTPEGEAMALQILRRHRLLELFLVQELELDWSEVHEDAEALEHAVSERVLDRIDEVLGRPAFDPHGDPIPGPDGATRKRRLAPLTACEIGAQARLARVVDQSSEYLRFLNRNGLCLGARLTVLGVEPAAEAISLQADDAAPVTMGFGAAEKLLVEVVDD